MSSKLLIADYRKSRDPAAIFRELQQGDLERQKLLLQDPFILVVLFKSALMRVPQTFQTLKSIPKDVQSRIQQFKFPIIALSLLNQRLSLEQEIEILDYLSQFSDLGIDAICAGLAIIQRMNPQEVPFALALIKNNLQHILADNRKDVMICMKAIIQRSREGIVSAECANQALDIINQLGQ